MKSLKPLSQMPGPKGPPIVGNAREVVRDRLGFFTRAMLEHGDHARLRLGPFTHVLLSNPDDIRRVLVTDHENYVKSRDYEALRVLLDGGLITAEGVPWKRKRALVQPSVHPRRLGAFFDPMQRCTNDMVDRWSDESVLDVHREMTQLTFRIIGFLLLSKDLAREARPVAEALDFALQFANDYTDMPFRPPIWWPLPSHIRLWRHMKSFDRIVLPLIEERRRDPGRHGDLLDALLEAQEEGQKQLSDRELRAELLTMVAAGHETTANALTWTFYLLSQHPDIARRVEAEVDEVVGHRGVFYQDLPRLEYLERVIKEAMRLYPPAWIFGRENVVDVELGGFRIPRGSTISICSWALHRNPQYWEDPERFDPDRFLPERSVDRPRYAYLPFGAGPRVCAGASLAMTEAKLILATVVKHYRLSLVPNHLVVPEALITLRPAHGMKMALERRSKEKQPWNPISIQSASASSR